MTASEITAKEITVSARDALRRGLLRVHGRSEALADGSITCDFTACGIAFTLDCAGEVRLTVSVHKPPVDLTPYATDHGYFTVLVDGERADRAVRGGGTAVETKNGVRVEGCRAEVILASGLPAGRHTFGFFKQSDPHMNLAEIHALTFTGTFALPPAAKKVLVEFIGDSLTAGYGNLGAPGIGSSDADYQEGTSTYPVFAAGRLGFDVRVVARAGIGLRYCATYSQRPMSEVWHLQSYWRDEKKEYVPDRIPDLVVLNLFANDRTKILSDKYPDANDIEYELALRLFLEQLWKFYPGVQILLLNHPGSCEKLSWVLEHVVDISGPLLSVADYHRYNQSGYASHPDIAHNRLQAEELVTELLWRYPDLFPSERS